MKGHVIWYLSVLYFLKLLEVDHNSKVQFVLQFYIIQLIAISNQITISKSNACFIFQDALKEVERLKMELSTLPEHVVVETTEHKCLQSQFSVLYNEAMQLKTQLEEARNQLQVIISKTIFQFLSILIFFVFFFKDFV